MGRNVSGHPANTRPQRPCESGTPSGAVGPPSCLTGEVLMGPWDRPGLAAGCQGRTSGQWPRGASALSLPQTGLTATLTPASAGLQAPWGQGLWPFHP